MAGIKLDKCPCCGIEIEPVKFQEARDTLYLDSNDIKPKFRWIQCSEKKPEIWKEVLVVLNDNGYKSIHIGEMQEEGSWMIGGEFWYEKDDPRITHWMPLPDPPKEVDDA